MNMFMIWGLLKPFVPKVIKTMPELEQKAVTFFEAQNVPTENDKFNIAVMVYENELWAVPTFVNSETKIVTQTKIEINGTTYEAIRLSDLAIQFLNKKINV